MALINCPECGKQVSDKASSCPQCGCPISGGNVTSKPTTAQIRIVAKVPFLKVDGRSVSSGSIVEIYTTSSKRINIEGHGGDIGVVGHNTYETVCAGHKYDLETKKSFGTKWFYLKEVSSFV